MTTETTETAEKTLTKEEAEVDRAEWATGLCSAHQRPDPLCRLCNPALAAAEAVAQREAGEVARMRDRAQRAEAREAVLREALDGLARAVLENLDSDTKS